MDLNVFLKVFCVIEYNKVNRKMKVIEGGEIYVVNEVFYLK